MCLTCETLMEVDSLPVKRPDPRHERQGLCLDKGYDYPIVRILGDFFRLQLHLRTRGEEKRMKKRSRKHKARRWVVERSHSWMNRFRALLIRWAKKEANYMAQLHIALALIVASKTGLCG
jgi:hypothetical protein